MLGTGIGTSVSVESWMNQVDSKTPHFLPDPRCQRGTRSSARSRTMRHVSTKRRAPGGSPRGASGVAARIGGSGLAAAPIGVADAVLHSGADDPVGDKYAEGQNQEPLHPYLKVHTRR